MTLDELKVVFTADLNPLQKAVEKVKRTIKSVDTKKTVDFGGNRQLDTLIRKLSAVNMKIAAYKTQLTQLRDQESLMSYGGVSERNAEAYAKLQVKIANVNGTMQNLITTSNTTASEINKVETALNDANGSTLSRIRTQLQQIGEQSQKSFTKLGKTFKGITRKLGRYAIALLGVGSIFSVITRSITNYLNSNEKLKTSMDFLYFSIGQAFAPLLEKLVQFGLQAVNVINQLAMAFFGVNLLAGATDKYIDSINGGLKETSKFLAPFDEIVNISQTGSGGGLSSGLIPEFEFDDTVSTEVQRVVDKVKNLYDWFMKNKEVIIAVGTTLAGVFVVSKLASFLGIMGGAGAAAAMGTGLLGILGVLLAIAALGTIVVTIASIYKTIKSGNEVTKAVLGTSTNLANDQSIATKNATTVSEKAKLLSLYRKQLSDARTQVQKATSNYNALSFFGKLSGGTAYKNLIQTWQVQVDSLTSQISALGGGTNKGYYNGGRPKQKDISLVGERGPELFVPDSPGRIMSNTNFQKLGQSQSNGQQELNVPDIILDGVLLSRGLSKYNQNESSRMGTSVVTVS